MLTLSDGSELAVVTERLPSRSYGRRFVIVFEDAIDALSDKIRSGPTLRVMLKLAKRLDFDAWRRVDQRKLGEELEMNQSSISHAMRHLVALSMIERKGSGAHVEWRLTPNFGWRGTPEQYHAAQRERAAAQRPRPPTKNDGRIMIIMEFYATAQAGAAA